MATASGPASAGSGSLSDRLFAWGLAHPDTLFMILRVLKPNLYIKKKQFGIVTRFEDVSDVLHHDEAFEVPYGEKMRQLAGRDFFLGMQDSPEYTRDVSNMRIVVRRDDVPHIADYVVTRSNELLDDAGGRIDVVRGLGRRVPAQWTFAYFGLPGPGEPGGPESEVEFIDWTLNCFEFLFLDPTDDPEIEQRAMVSAAGIKDWLDAAIAQRKSSGFEGRDDVLSRCLALEASGTPGMSDEAIRTNLFGIIVGAIPTTAMAAAQALDVLLDRPDELQGAHEAARSGNDGLLARYVFEALRFNPQAPGVLRTVAREYRIAAGKFRARTFPVGTTLLVATRSAMRDPRGVPGAGSFRLDRPPHSYMHFGLGMHACFGTYINLVQIPGLLKPLLARRDLARVEGPKGKLQTKGPYPRSLYVQFSDGVPASGRTAGRSGVPQHLPSDIRLYTLPPDLDSETTRWMLGLYGMPFVEHTHVPVIAEAVWKWYGSSKEEKRQVAENKIEPPPPYVPLADPLVIVDGRKLWNVLQFLEFFEPIVPPERRLVPEDADESFWKEFHQVWDEYPFAVTRWYYDWMLPYRKPVLHTFNMGVPRWEAVLTTMLFPLFRFVVRRALKLSLEKTMESERIMDKHMALANDKLADGRPYLMGDRLTIADIVFCTTTAPIVGERNYGPLPNTLPRFEDMPEEMRRRIQGWAEEPAGKYVKRVYAEHRGRPLTG